MLMLFLNGALHSLQSGNAKSGEGNINYVADGVKQVFKFSLDCNCKGRVLLLGCNTIGVCILYCAVCLISTGISIYLAGRSYYEPCTCN